MTSPIYVFHRRPWAENRNGRSLRHANRMMWRCVDCMAGIRERCRKLCSSRVLGEAYFEQQRRGGEQGNKANDGGQ